MSADVLFTVNSRIDGLQMHYQSANETKPSTTHSLCRLDDGGKQRLGPLENAARTKTTRVYSARILTFCPFGRKACLRFNAFNATAQGPWSPALSCHCACSSTATDYYNVFLSQRQSDASGPLGILLYRNVCTQSNLQHT